MPSRRGLWIILGGKDKGSDYTVLREPLRQRARSALLIGAAAEKIASHLGDAVRLAALRRSRNGGRRRRQEGRGWRNGTARARLRELRSVPEFRTPRRGVQRTSEGVRVEHGPEA